MTHTPGPWRVIEKVGFSVYPEDSPVYIAFMNNARSNCEVNANLMAAAPEMLEALEDVQKYVTFQMHLDHEKEIAEKVDKAIAKAKGE